MFNPINLTAKDGDYEIIYSADFNIYENKLSLEKIEDFSFEFLFQIDSTKKDSPIDIKGDNIEKKIIITLYNFNNSLGVGLTKKIPILSLSSSGKQLYFSLHAKSLNDATPFLKVSLTFYTK